MVVGGWDRRLRERKDKLKLSHLSPSPISSTISSHLPPHNLTSHLPSTIPPSHLIYHLPSLPSHLISSHLILSPLWSGRLTGIILAGKLGVSPTYLLDGRLWDRWDGKWDGRLWEIICWLKKKRDGKLISSHLSSSIIYPAESPSFS